MIHKTGKKATDIINIDKILRYSNITGKNRHFKQILLYLHAFMSKVISKKEINIFRVKYQELNKFIHNSIGRE